MREFVFIQFYDLILFKRKLLYWANGFSRCCVLDSNQWNGNEYELIIAADCIEEITPGCNTFEKLKRFHQLKKDWLFGYLSYDLKNETERLSSKNHDGLQFPQMHFFQPKYVFTIKNNRLEIGFLPEISSHKEVEELIDQIQKIKIPEGCDSPSSVSINSRVSKKAYLDAIHQLQEYIHKGEIYEINYCMEFFCDDTAINPEEIFTKLNASSQAPFAAFYKMHNKFLICGSPERFLKKTGKTIISQPMKGTAKRGKIISEDNEAKRSLSGDEKEKSENVMIVDLVRNDLSKTCIHVTVNELFGIYTFQQWHQMISTISGELREGTHFIEVIKNSFPMGSMTGAPKVRAMELIEQYEKTKRGVYSGAVGFITPEGDFDFNVVIRSIVYNRSSKYLSFHVGSAITANSIPEKEYEECLLKAKGMFEALVNPYQPDRPEGVLPEQMGSLMGTAD